MDVPADIVDLGSPSLFSFMSDAQLWCACGVNYEDYF